MKNNIDLDKIENPIVRRALQQRMHEFMFNYGDGTGGGPPHRDSTTTTDFPEHSDYNKYGDYSERSGHSDEYASGQRRSEHVDITRRVYGPTHSDERYSEYNDYHPPHSDTDEKPYWFG